jgi:hypothetical protein
MFRPNTIGWAEQVSRINAYKLWSENLKGRDLSENLGVGRRIKLNFELK